MEVMAKVHVQALVFAQVAEAWGKKEVVVEISSRQEVEEV